MDDYYENEAMGGGLSLPQLILNALTVLVLIATALAGVVFVLLLINPQMPFNPYPPPTLPPTLGPPTATNTPEIYLPPTWTSTITDTPIPSATPVPTKTFTPTLTPTATETVPPPPTLPASEAQFQLQEGSPAYIADERGCDVMGVGGKVFDMEGSPIVGLAVRMSGELAGQSIGTLDTLTGSAADRLGLGGYYFEISDTPLASENTLWIQVLDSSSGLPLSDQLYLTTYSTCEQNLVLVNWVQVFP
jgi:hypothetical protein